MYNLPLCLSVRHFILFYFSSPFSVQGLTVLLHGASGTGKTLAAVAIGYEVGKPLKVFFFNRVEAGIASKRRRKETGLFSLS